jgi:L,D-transpeptidase YcbB
MCTRRSSPWSRAIVVSALAWLVPSASLFAAPPPDPGEAPAAAPSPASDAHAAELMARVRRRAAQLPATADGAALASYYAERTTPLWIDAQGLTPKARLAMAEIARADDWGLSAAAFKLPRRDGADLADSEVKLSLAVLTYARFARGGRVDVASFSRSVDQQLNLREPKAVLEAIADTDAPGDYLTGLHPTHRQFGLLRQALLRLRGGAASSSEEAVRLPEGPLLKPGIDHPDVALLRRRLKVATEGAPATLYDQSLVAAVMAFQREHGIAADGIIGPRGRALLNGERAAPLSGGSTERIVLNMERWRWMPEHLGEFHVWNNIPEFVSRVFNKGRLVHAAKIVVGKPDTQTVVFSADMRYLVFHPEWGVPDSIKVKEILPYLRPSGGDFFGLFGGADTSILERHNLKVSYNGHPIDASQVNWSEVDVRRYSFIQPAGAGNVLGVVKFRFPNRHDIYMHDTPQRELFAKATRAYSHGCIRVEHPDRLAELLLAKDKGWSAEQVRGLLAEGYNNEVALEHEIPVHVTYFTAVADDEGRIAYFADIYGLDARLAAALAGRPLPLEAVPEDGLRETRRARAYKSTNDFFSGLFGN